MSGPGYDYFGDSPRPTSPFGAGPATPPPPPPPLAGPTPFGAPTPTPFGEPTPPAPSGLSGLRSTPSGLAVAALLVVALAGGGWWWTHRGDGLPDHLGPYARSTDPAITQVMDAAMVQVRGATGGSGHDVRAAAYGTTAGDAFLLEVEGPMVDSMFAAQRAGMTSVGGSLCMGLSRTTLCLRSAGERAVVVMTSGNEGLQETGRWTDQAWAATR